LTPLLSSYRLPDHALSPAAPPPDLTHAQGRWFEKTSGEVRSWKNVIIKQLGATEGGKSVRLRGQKEEEGWVRQ